MDIIFANRKLERQCNSLREARKKWGTRRGDLVLKRLNEMADADNLRILQALPQARCHQLTGNLAGKWSVDLEHPYRLIFEPANDPIPKTPDGGLDVGKVTAIMILEVRDTHGK